MPMLSRSVRPAGNRHSYRGYVAGTGAPGRPVTCQRCTGPTRFPGGGSRALRGRQRAPEIDVPGKLGRGRPQPGRTPGDDGNGDTGNGRAHTGAVCARDGPRPGTAGHGLPGHLTFADTGSGWRRAVAEGSAGTALARGWSRLQARRLPSCRRPAALSGGSGYSRSGDSGVSADAPLLAAGVGAGLRLAVFRAVTVMALLMNACASGRWAVSGVVASATW
jgi:hypothetical protein